MLQFFGEKATSDINWLANNNNILKYLQGHKKSKRKSLVKYLSILFVNEL
ncbi:MAG TPA: hypothetical protein VE244_02525 [Nitrososphaeraceae archaeon]|jgi:hypothetical protein|nr:hypothetical protein [Nitrososphaeraceae archaeon]